MIERAADTVPLIRSGLPPVAIEATIPPPSIIHFPAKNTSGGVHSFRIRPVITFAAPIGVLFSTISFTSRARPTVEITGPTYGNFFTKDVGIFII